MNISTIITALFIAFGFVSWVIVGSYSKLSAGWVGTIVMFSTTIAVALLFGKQLVSGPLPGIRPIIYLIIAGVINGIGVYLYSSKATDPSISTGVFIVTVCVSMAVFAPLIDWILNGRILSLQQGTGVFFAVIAIYFLTK
ncbi:hypothetical protein KAU19_01910 [Candidatus Parcubacteria bacterium]|nr:hypothetical protein [Candidatus Parcubacteria bacterium]